jgi:hypothetical protein
MPNSGSGTGTPIVPPGGSTLGDACPSKNLLPLDEFRRLMGFNPFHFWGLANDKVRITSSCNPLTMQYAWQNTDAVGRAEVLDAIGTAETRLREELGYSIAPHCVLDTVPFPRYYDPRQNYARSWDARANWISLQLSQGYIQETGATVNTVIVDAAAALTDTDGDGLYDTFTLTVATTVTDPDQLAVYFTSADRFDGSPLSERWRVLPVRTTISGGTATIKGRAWTIIRPVLYEGVSTQALDPDTIGNYAGHLTVCRRACDTTQQGFFVWETVPTDSCLDPCSIVPLTLATMDPAAQFAASARFALRNAEQGVVAGEVARYNATSGEWQAYPWPPAWAPAHAVVSYRAGMPLVSGQVDAFYATIVARLAAAELAKPICGCEVANRELARWQLDLAQVSGRAEENYSYSPTSLDNGFGTRRGHLAAWQAIRTLRQVRATTTG